MEEGSRPGRDASSILELIPARMLNEFAYCPRLFYLERMHGEWADSADTVEGSHAHRRVEKESGALPAAGEAEEKVTIHARSVSLSAPKVGLVAVIDLLEGEGNVVTPVDYKRGAKPDIPEGAYEPERVQLCAQGLILRENGYECNEGVLYFARSRERVTIPFDEALVERTLYLLQELRKTEAGGQIPPPLIDSPKCPRCSLVTICLPDEVNLLSSSGMGGRRVEVRRLFPARDDALPVYVQAQGARVTKKGDLLEIWEKEKGSTEVRLLEVSQLCLLGNVQVTVQLIRELCDRGVPLCYFSFGGWFYGITHGMTHKNVELRMRQYEAAFTPPRTLAVATNIVEGKIRNQRTMLRRNHEGCPQPVLDELARLTDLTALAPDLGALIGIEGAAAQLYFAHFAGMLKQAAEFDFRERNRRPPTDPVNALLSFLYAVLAKDLAVVSMAVGLDPYLGYLHRPRYGRPSLALDLMEPFRPILCDSVVISVLNTGEIQAADFVKRGPAVGLKEEGRRKLLRAYERRMDDLVTHPIFGYTISYRRVLEVQTRLLARHLSGELPTYPPFCTR